MSKISGKIKSLGKASGDTFKSKTGTLKAKAKATFRSGLDTFRWRDSTSSNSSADGPDSIVTPEFCLNGHPVYTANPHMFYLFYEAIRKHYHELQLTIREQKFPHTMKQYYTLSTSEKTIWDEQTPEERPGHRKTEVFEVSESIRQRLGLTENQITLAIRRELSEPVFTYATYMDPFGEWNRWIANPPDDLPTGPDPLASRCDLLNFINGLTIDREGNIRAWGEMRWRTPFKPADLDNDPNHNHDVSPYPYNPIEDLRYKQTVDDYKNLMGHGRAIGVHSAPLELQREPYGLVDMKEQLAVEYPSFEPLTAGILPERFFVLHNKAFAIYCIREYLPQYQPLRRFRAVAALFAGIRAGVSKVGSLSGKIHYDTNYPPTMTIEASLPLVQYDNEFCISYGPGHTPSSLDVILALKEASLQWGADGRLLDPSTPSAKYFNRREAIFQENDFQAREILYALGTHEVKVEQDLVHQRIWTCIGKQELRSRDDATMLTNPMMV